jgi:cell division topological specificity factor
MFEFFRSLFSPAPPSGATAKERLRLVLLSDHLSLAPDVVEAMKRDLLEVLSRYVEIDVAHADVTFEQREAEVAMLASVPITGVRERRATPEPIVTPEPAIIEPAVAEPVAAEPLAAEPVAVPRAPRRRRRKKAGAANGQPPGQPGLATSGVAASQA